jgi:hypothetical protein
MRLAVPLFLCSLFTFHCSMDSKINQTFFYKQDPHLKIQPVQKITEVDFNNFPCYLAPDFEAPYRISNGSYLSREFDSVGLPSAAHQIEIGMLPVLPRTPIHTLFCMYTTSTPAEAAGAIRSSICMGSAINPSICSALYSTTVLRLKSIWRDGTIKVQSQAYLDGDANCCPGALAYDEFMVENDSFVLKAFQTVKRRL